MNLNIKIKLLRDVIVMGKSCSISMQSYGSLKLRIWRSYLNVMNGANSISLVTTKKHLKLFLRNRKHKHIFPSVFYESENMLYTFVFTERLNPFMGRNKKLLY